MTKNKMRESNHEKTRRVKSRTAVLILLQLFAGFAVLVLASCSRKTAPQTTPPPPPDYPITSLEWDLTGEYSYRRNTALEYLLQRDQTEIAESLWTGISARPAEERYELAADYPTFKTFGRLSTDSKKKWPLLEKNLAGDFHFQIERAVTYLQLHDAPTAEDVLSSMDFEAIKSLGEQLSTWLAESDPKTKRALIAGYPPYVLLGPTPNRPLPLSQLELDLLRHDTDAVIRAAMFLRLVSDIPALPLPGNTMPDNAYLGWRQYTQTEADIDRELARQYGWFEYGEDLYNRLMSLPEDARLRLTREYDQLSMLERDMLKNN